MGYALPSGVINTNSAYFFATAAMSDLGPLVKQLGDQTLVIVDYSKAGTSPLVSVAFTIDTSSNPQLVVSYSNVDQPGNTISFLVSGGIAGQQYNIKIAAQTNTTLRSDMLTVNIPSYDDCSCLQINPVPQQYNQLPLGTQGYVNTGTRYFWGSAAPANPAVLDQWFNTTTSTLYEWVTDGTSSHWEMIASADLVTEAPESGLIYGRYNGHWVPNTIQTDAPADGSNYRRWNNTWVVDPLQTDATSDGNTYGRNNGAWVAVPVPAISNDAPSNNIYYSRRNGVWMPFTWFADALSNGNVYGRSNGSWAQVLPLTGGALSGGLSMQGDLSVAGSANVGGNLMVGGVANFSAQVTLPYDPIAPLQAVTKQYVDGKFLTLAGASTDYLPLAGGTLTGALMLAADPGVALGASTKQYVDGRTPITLDAPNDGQAYCRQNDGWVVSPSGGMSDAPNNTYVFMRGQQAWNSGGTLAGNLTVNGVMTLGIDPAAPLQAATKQYVDARLTAPSTTPPLMDGTANVGTSSAFARGDHVHPTDTSRYAASNPSGYVNLGQAAAAAPVQSVAGRAGAVILTHNDLTDWVTTLAPYALLASPVFTGGPTAPTATPGNSSTQIATTAFVSNAIASAGGSYLALAGGTMTGPLILSASPTVNLGAATKAYVDTLTNSTLDMGTF